MAPAIFLGATPLLSSETPTLPGSSPAIVTERLVLRCPSCRMVQYATKANRCRRCYAPLVLPAPPPQPAPRPPARPNVAAGVRHWRRLRGLTQKQLASCSQLPRTYISRIENGRIVPGLLTLERVAGALNVPLPALLLASGLNGSAGGNGNGNGGGGGDPAGYGFPNGPAPSPTMRIPAPVSDVDACLRELLRYSGVLTGAQRHQVLVRVRTMVPSHLVMSH